MSTAASAPILLRHIRRTENGDSFENQGYGRRVTLGGLLCSTNQSRKWPRTLFFFSVWRLLFFVLFWGFVIWNRHGHEIICCAVRQQKHVQGYSCEWPILLTSQNGGTPPISTVALVFDFSTERHIVRESCCVPGTAQHDANLKRMTRACTEWHMLLFSITGERS